MNKTLEENMQKMLNAHKELKLALRSHQSRHQLRFGEFGAMACILEVAQSSGKPFVDTGVPMKMLADELNRTPAMVTKLITGLEEQGYVRRELSTDDRRGVKVCVTQKGYDVWQSDHALYHETIEAIGEKMGMDRLMLLFELAEEFVRFNKEVICESDKKDKENNNG